MPSYKVMCFSCNGEFETEHIERLYALVKTCAYCGDDFCDECDAMDELPNMHRDCALKYSEEEEEEEKETLDEN